MVIDEYDGSSIRQINRVSISKNAEYQKLIAELRKIEKFLNNFGLLQFGRDFVLCGKRTISLQLVSTACELTAGSVISCCENGCMADAFSLLRKYRDDMFFYLYLVVYDTDKKLNNQSPRLDKMEINIERWLNNNLCDLPISTVFQEIGKSPRMSDAVKKYNLKSYFDKIRDRLNNYVHSNGVIFYNLNVNAYRENDLQKQIQELLKDMLFLTTTFLFLLVLCSPLSVMSTDYVDSLDFGETPQEGSQYWVAPFVTRFIKANIDQIDESCMQYLRDNTCMDFE